MARRAYKWVWNARVQRETPVSLRKLAMGLGFRVTAPGKYHGTPSAPDFLDALAECYSTDPGGTHLALKVLLDANDLLPERGDDAAE